MLPPVMSSLEADFLHIQHAFIAHLREPGRHPMPEGVAPERMRLYRELFINNIDSFLANGYPVLKSILEGERWDALVRDFFAEHRSRTPLFGGIAEEFLHYVHEERGERAGDPAFLQELAHYEWVELALTIAEAEPPPETDLPLDPLDLWIFLSPVAWPLAYRFPVQRIGPEFQPEIAPDSPTFLAVYRDREDAIRFLELNAATFRLLHLLKTEGPLLARDCLLRLASELGYSNPETILEFGTGLLCDLYGRGTIGTERPEIIP